MVNQKWNFAAFISYKSQDEKWAKWLQNELETYRLPVVICKKHPELSKGIGKCFRYHTDIQPGILTQELQSKLEESRYLLVICSPRSAKSSWVGQEISVFKELGREKNIIPVIVDGFPYSGDDATECLHPVIKALFPKTDDPATDKEILGVNLNEEGEGSNKTKRKRAVIRIVSRLTGVSFDSLWDREKIRTKRRIAAWITGIFAIIVALFLSWKAALPFDVTLAFTENAPNVNLPPIEGGASVELFLDEEVKTDTIHSASDIIIFRNIPSKYRGDNIKLKITPYLHRTNSGFSDYKPLDTLVSLTGTSNVTLQRNKDFYGKVRFRLYHKDRNLSGHKIRIDQYDGVADENGMIILDIPIESQRPYYLLNSDISLTDSILIMPSGSMRVIEVNQ